jgi:hypothetical protein
MKNLFGVFIRNIYISEDKTVLLFITDEYLVYRAEGECCSQSWFESISNPENIILNKNTCYKKIIGIEEKQCVLQEHPDHDCLSVYGYTLKTSEGYCDIEYRNSSNGYYGGSCEEIKEFKVMLPDGSISTRPSDLKSTSPQLFINMYNSEYIMNPYKTKE